MDTLGLFGPAGVAAAAGEAIGGYWDAGPEFATHYSGRVVANLASADRKHMRCIFQLVHPSNGMAGGGSGKCQLPEGKTIDTTFPTA